MISYFKKYQAIAIACLCMGLLYLARGAFLPYFYPIYENISKFNYWEIAVLLNVFVFIQAVISPFTGLFIDKYKISTIIYLGVVLYIVGLAILFSTQNFLLNLFCVAILGTALMTLRNALCVSVIHNAEESYLRKAVAIRSTFMNVGSFAGNIMALGILAAFGAKIHVLFLIAILFLLGFVYTVTPSSSNYQRIKEINHSKLNFKVVLKNYSYIADALTILAVIIPDGCWGTIIPKVLIDVYHSNHILVLIYAVSLTAIVSCSYLLNGWLVSKLKKYGFRVEWCKWLALCFFLIGLSLLTFANRPVLLCIGIFIFILGEIIVAPCYDEIAKKYALNKTGVGSYFGTLGIFDGVGRLIGSAIAFSLYGKLRFSKYLFLFWPLLAAIFLTLASLICFIAQKFRSYDQNKQLQKPKFFSSKSIHEEIN